MTNSYKTPIYLLFSLSGFCALIYEILWTRYLSLTFGTTIVAVSIVAATFMGGLALGSYLLGRYADHQRNLLRIYAFLELGIALTALLLPPTLNIVESIYVSLVRSFPESGGLTHALRFFFSAMLIIPPTACMGGTFPLMCRFFARKKSGGQIGRLYALNTLGATLGAFLSGYLLIPVVGLSTTGYLAIACNLLIAAATYRLSFVIVETEAVDVSKVKRPEQPLLIRKHLPTLLAIGIVGFLGLAYEILWTRVFLLFLGNTTYAFALMLSAYLVGIAGGGAIYARMARPEMDEKQIFVRLTVVMSLSLLAILPLYDRLAELFLMAHQASGERWWHLSMLSYLIVLSLISIPTLISGALLPAAVALLDPGRIHTGEGVGLVVLFNTVGAVVGSLIAGFALIPAFGLQGSFKALAAVNIALSLALYLRLRPTAELRFTCPALLTVGVILLVIPMSWDQSLMNSGVYIYAPKYLRMGGLDKVLSQEKVIEVIEGSETTVAIHESNDGRFRFFTVNGKTDGGTGQDMSTQILVGHVPMLLHPEPREALVIGLGTGITLKGLQGHPVERIDCVEISPEVVKAYDYFKATSGDPLQHAKFRLHIDDGRNFLLTSTKKYDVIISEPSNPWQAGNANLFTSDFYQLAVERLTVNGIFCQWIGLYDITPENLQVLIKTFIRTFPHALVFKAGSDLVIAGATHELNFDYQKLRRRLEDVHVRQALNEIGVSSPGELIAMHYLFSEEPLLEISSGARINTDDRPILEYSARYNLGEKTMGEFQAANMQLLLKSSDKIFLPIVNLGKTTNELADALREIGKGYSKAGRRSEAEHFMRKASEVESLQQS